MFGGALTFFAVLGLLSTVLLVSIPLAWWHRPRPDGALTLLVVAGAALATGALVREAMVALVAGALCLLVIAVMRLFGRDWALLGLTVLLSVAGVSGTYIAYVAVLTARSNLPVVGTALSVILLVLEVAALAMTLSFVHELLDVMATPTVPEPAPPVPARWPRVCIQVPAYNEPVDLLKETLNALARLDYPRFMVQLVDNNTTDPGLWRPIEAHCRDLGRRFRFIHLENWPGYKSGALNEATRRLPSDVDVVAVVDADYVVEPQFLRETVGHFVDPDVAFVQTPQHYREWADDGYLAALFYAYKYFYDITMPFRGRRNAIIFAGTMGLIRRSVLDRIGGWDEWCITEDAEASLRILAEGWRGVYIDKPYGHGLMPLSFDGLKKQRFRWAFGGIQILKKHWHLLLTGRRPDGSRSGLTIAQRYHYLVGGLQWYNELLTISFTLLLITSGAVLAVGRHLPMRQLSAGVLAIPIVLMTTSVARLTWALKVRGGATLRQALGAVSVLFSLSLVSARASILALVRRKGVFLRTPKLRSESGLRRSLMATRTESIVAGSAWVLAAMILLTNGGAVRVAIGVLLVFQGAFYATAPVSALRAEGIRLTPLRRQFRLSPQNTGQRPRSAALVRRARNTAAALGLAALAAGLLGVLAITPEGGGLFPAGGLLPPATVTAGNPGASSTPTSTPSATLSPPGQGSSPGTGAATGTTGTPSGSAGLPVPAPSGTSPAPGQASSTPSPVTRPGATPSALATPVTRATPAPTARPTSTPTPRH